MKHGISRRSCSLTCLTWQQYLSSPGAWSQLLHMSKALKGRVGGCAGMGLGVAHALWKIRSLPKKTQKPPIKCNLFKVFKVSHSSSDACVSFMTFMVFFYRFWTSTPPPPSYWVRCDGCTHTHIWFILQPYTAHGEWTHCHHLSSPAMSLRRRGQTKSACPAECWAYECV